jgi:hypothetical protein
MPAFAGMTIVYPYCHFAASASATIRAASAGSM